MLVYETLPHCVHRSPSSPSSPVVYSSVSLARTLHEVQPVSPSSSNLVQNGCTATEIPPHTRTPVGSCYEKRGKILRPEGSPEHRIPPPTTRKGNTRSFVTVCLAFVCMRVNGVCGARIHACPHSCVGTGGEREAMRLVLSRSLALPPRSCIVHPAVSPLCAGRRGANLAGNVTLAWPHCRLLCA